MKLLRNWKFWILAIPGLFLALIVLIVVFAEPVEEDTPTQVVAVVDATPTAAESLQEFTLCTHLKANKSLTWGQAPGVIYSGDPRVTGQIEQGDYVKVLSPPDEDGNIRVEVFPHDSRAVGADGKVWISWSALTQHRLDRDMFTCEA